MEDSFYSVPPQSKISQALFFPNVNVVHIWKAVTATRAFLTLHARPTDIQEGDQRTLCRMCSYLNHLYPEKGPVDFVLYKGRRISKQEFVILVDMQRAKDHAAEKAALMRTM